MPGVILVLLGDPAAAPRLLAAAARLAEVTGGAAINALIVRSPPLASIIASEEVLTKRREALLRAEEQARADSLSEIFRNWASRENGQPHVSEVEASVTDAIVQRGPAADFVVIEQPVRRYDGTAWQAMLAALFETDRPVLVVPPNPSPQFGRRIAVAWRDDDRTIRAVLAAMRCLGDVEQLLVLAGQREGAARPAMPPIVVEHRVAAELLVLPVDGQAFGKALLGKAHELRADMIVMGAYVHDPIRRLVLGGLTRYMLTNSDLPLLMRH
ncbi:MAG TPA: universal stress protein [Acetobacteraceae bacterium]|jgi:nucleotide-binding universal stress UspA family protein|nr:universal stress protein [Acetobacteraceae bacterium]